MTDLPQILKGRQRRAKVLELLQGFRVFAGMPGLDEELYDAGKLEMLDVSPTPFIVQGAKDTDIFLILQGRVHVVVNCCTMAERVQGQTVGEMAVIEPLGSRSASVYAKEPTVVLRIKEVAFTRICSQYPEVWRRLASELVHRLRQRNRFVREPNEKPMIFVASSSEGLNVAEALKQALDLTAIVCRIWTDGIFKLSSNAMTDLQTCVDKADFGVCVMTPDDRVKSRGKVKYAPRDNVVFELGMLVGRLGLDRAILLKPKKVDLKMPSDLTGVMWLEYDPNGNGRTLQRRIGAAAGVLMAHIDEKGVR